MSRRIPSLLPLVLLAATAASAELPPPGDCAGTYWDLTAVFEGGDRVDARVLLTRAGPGDLVAAGQGYWRDADGVETAFHNGRRAGQFHVGKRGRDLRIGSTELDLAAATHRFEVDNDKRAVKLRLEIEAHHAVDQAVHGGDLAVSVVHLGSPARVRLWRGGMATPRSLRGHATLVRTRHARCERDLLALRLDLHQLAAGGIVAADPRAATGRDAQLARLAHPRRRPAFPSSLPNCAGGLAEAPGRRTNPGSGDADRRRSVGGGRDRRDPKGRGSPCRPTAAGTDAVLVRGQPAAGVDGCEQQPRARARSRCRRPIGTARKPAVGPRPRQLHLPPRAERTRPLADRGPRRMSMRIGVLNNLRAGSRERPMAQIFDVLRRRSDVVHVETESARVLGDALAELERQEIDVLVTNGGDGTLQYVLTELLSDPRREHVPWIAPLRGGRTNMTATDLGADRHAARGLARLLADADAGRLAERAVSRPVLRLRSSCRDGDLYGMFFGAGLIHRAIGVVHRVFPPGRTQGLFGASIVTGALVAKMLFKPTQGILTPDKCSVRVSGREVADAEFYLLIASTLDRLFLRMDPFWGKGPGGVRLTAVSSDAERLARAAPGVLRGRPPRWIHGAAGYTSERTERAEIRMSCGFTVDGELFDPEPEERVALEADRRVVFLRA